MTVAGKAAVITWALAVAVVMLIHGTTPHGARAGYPLSALRAAATAAVPCHDAQPGHGVRSDPGDEGRPSPWRHLDAAPHRTAQTPQGHGQTCRGCSGTRLAEAARAPLTPPDPAVHVPHARRPALELLQVFRC